MGKLFFLLLISLNLEAAVCSRAVDCILEASRLTGIKYIYPEGMFKPTPSLNIEIQFTKENADTALSEALHIFGFSRIPSKLKGTLKIIPSAELFHHNLLPTFYGAKKSSVSLPENYDPIMFIYKGEPDTDIESIAKNIAPFLSKYGRITDMRGGTLVIVDASVIVSKLIPLIQMQDFPMTKEEKKKKEEEIKRKKKELPE